MVVSIDYVPTQIVTESFRRVFWTADKLTIGSRQGHVVDDCVPAKAK